MKTATVRDLRSNFSKLEAWLLDGKEVRIEKRGEPVAMLPALKEPRTAAPVKNPDFEARRKAIWGDRVFSEEEVRSMRADEFLSFDGNQRTLAASEELAVTI